MVRWASRGFAFRFTSLTLDDDDDDDAADAGRTALHARRTTRLVLLLLPLKLPLAPVPGRSARMTCGWVRLCCVCGGGDEIYGCRGGWKRRGRREEMKRTCALRRTGKLHERVSAMSEVFVWHLSVLCAVRFSA